VKTHSDKYSLHGWTSLGKARKAKIERDLFEYMFPSLSESARVLEVGPGHGQFAFECRRRNLDFLGIEPSLKLRQELINEGFAIIDGMVPPIPLDDNQFDLVHSHDFVEHLLDYQTVMEFFLESYRVLKPGGHISVVAPNYRTIKHLFFQYEYQHSYITTIGRLRNLLSDCGFTIVETRAFLYWMSPKLNRVDRLLAQVVIPLATNAFFEFLIARLFSEEFLFRVHKNVFDHVALVAIKPYK
jgi:SAM-dependent methyltransferase